MEVGPGTMSGSFLKRSICLLALRREIKEQRVTAEDARLIAILDDIDLRASAELAKLGIT